MNLLAKISDVQEPYQKDKTIPKNVPTVYMRNSFPELHLLVISNSHSKNRKKSALFASKAKITILKKILTERPQRELRNARGAEGKEIKECQNLVLFTNQSERQKNS